MNTIQLPESHPPAGGPGPRLVCFLLVPEFSMLSFSAALEPLRVANTIAKRRLFDWRVVSADGRGVACSNGLTIDPEAAIDAVPRAWAVVVCGGGGSHLVDLKRSGAWLRRLDRAGARVGAISDGTYVLARAGLLGRRRSTIHWKCLPGFRETYPELAVEDAMYVIDGNRFTCSGGTASMDLMLRLIEDEVGRDLAMAVAENFMHGDIRSAGMRQRKSVIERHELGNATLAKALALMERHIEEPLTIAEIGARLGVSPRQVERLFAAYFQVTPRQFYRELRLQGAHHLLKHSSLSVTEIGIACGFVSMSHFAKCYRAYFGVSPRSERRRAA